MAIGEIGMEGTGIGGIGKNTVEKTVGMLGMLGMLGMIGMMKAKQECLTGKREVKESVRQSRHLA
jgi:hypothetical protein